MSTDTILTAIAKHPIVFTQSNRRFVLSQHYNGSDSFLFLVAAKTYQFKAKDSEIKSYPRCLSNIAKYCAIDSLKKKTGLKVSVNPFSVDYKSINTNEIIDIHKYLMKKLMLLTIQNVYG